MLSFISVTLTYFPKPRPDSYIKFIHEVHFHSHYICLSENVNGLYCVIFGEYNPVCLYAWPLTSKFNFKAGLSDWIWRHGYSAMKHSQCRIKANLFHVEAKVKEMLYVFLNLILLSLPFQDCNLQGKWKNAKAAAKWPPDFAPGQKYKMSDMTTALATNTQQTLRVKASSVVWAFFVLFRHFSFTSNFCLRLI